MLLITWVVSIFILSVTPLSHPKTEMPMDKVEHFIAYGIGALLFFGFFRRRKDTSNAALLSVLAASGYGAFIECVQYFIPLRSFSFYDMAANTIGAVAFCLPYAAWRKS